VVDQPYAPTIPVAQAPPEARSQFMTRTYARLMLGIAGFILLSWWLFTAGISLAIAEFVFGGGGGRWLVLLGGFMVVSWMATSLAFKATTPAMQYGTYALLIAANALIFAPMFVLAEGTAPGAIGMAAQVSVVAFAALSFIAIRTSKDFSFLRGFLLWGGFLALGLIVIGAFGGIDLGTWFSVAMIGFAGAAILYDTQKVFRSYPVGTETLAAMNLFSSIALLFWYVLRLFMARD
jgi:FtsH-binding integral membrane protein